MRMVLLVEDSLVNQKLMSMMLQNAGCETALATNGAEAVALFSENSFDLVLMDVQMPVMDGLEATRRIRLYEQEANQYTPIVAVTAGMDRDSCLEAGMDDYMAKPVRLDMLKEILNKFFRGDE